MSDTDKGAAPKPDKHTPPDSPPIGTIDPTPRILPEQPKPKEKGQ
jgi:hypothetical protein